MLFDMPTIMSTRTHSIADLRLVGAQWQNPNTMLAILSIVGGDIVHRAIAQLSGHPSCITPVTFSFGWLGYMLSSIPIILCEGRLMPPADSNCILINAKNQYSRPNRSWILGRLIRDHENDPMKPGLTVTFFKTGQNNETRVQGVPALDWVYYSGIAVTLIQFGIAVIPGAVYQDWSIFTVTAIGTVLALLHSVLPKWREEKWSGRRSLKEKDRTVTCLTRGNGYSDVMVIISEGKDQYRLEDLANARTTRAPGTVWIVSVLCIAQILLVLVMSSLTDHAWFLLVIGALGTVQNAVAAGVHRDLGTTGLHLEQQGEPVSDMKVMKALQRTEEQEQYVGISLLPVFFPGGLRVDEEEWRVTTLTRYNERKIHKEGG